MSQTRVDLAVLVDIWRHCPGARLVMEVENTALSDVYIEPNVLLATIADNVNT